MMLGSELAGANVRQREGKSPDHQLRPLKCVKLKERGAVAETARMLAWKQLII